MDIDTAIFASAVMAEGQSEQIACWNFNAAIEKLLADLNVPEYRMYCTGPNNFRYRVYPEYKSGRAQDPTYREAVKQHAVRNWGAVLSDGCEADDLLGVDQCQALLRDEEETMICSIDKDLLQIPGWNYSPEITRKGVVVRPAKRRLVSPQDGLRFFYMQLLTGDITDNIKGVPGIGPKKAEKILEGLTTKEEMYEAVSTYYSCEEELQMNAKVLFIWQQMNDNWERVMK